MTIVSEAFLSTYLSLKNLFLLLGKLYCMEYRLNLIQISHDNFHIFVKAQEVLLPFPFFFFPHYITV